MDAETDYSSWVGKSETLHDSASPTAAVRLEAIVGRTVDARNEGRSELSPLGHWAQFTPTTSMEDLGPDGHLRLGTFLPPLPLPRRMWAGSSITYHSPIPFGASLKKTTTIESITPKIGSSGRLCFIRLRHEVAADKVPALTEYQTIVYREAVQPHPEERSSRSLPRVSDEVPTGWDWSIPKRANEAMVFRYSALTFNAHRIHYDLAYATEVEGYPGIVVHAPLCMSLLMEQFLYRHPEKKILSLEFSARSPIFANELFHLVGRSDGAGAEELAVIGPDGAVSISARAAYAH